MMDQFLLNNHIRCEDEVSIPLISRGLTVKKRKYREYDDMIFGVWFYINNKLIAKSDPLMRIRLFRFRFPICV